MNHALSIVTRKHRGKSELSNEKHPLWNREETGLILMAVENKHMETTLPFREETMLHSSSGMTLPSHCVCSYRSRLGLLTCPRPRQKFFTHLSSGAGVTTRGTEKMWAFAAAACSCLTKKSPSRFKEEDISRVKLLSCF